MNYGIEMYGKHAVIKLRCKILASSFKSLQGEFEDLEFVESRKGYTLIKGCLPHQGLCHFKHQLAVSIAERKVSDAIKVHEDLVRPKHHAPVQWEEDDLPF